MRKTTHYIREEYGYTQQKLSKEYNIPLATIKNWDARGTMPNYIELMIIKCEITKSELKNAYKKISEEKNKAFEWFNENYELIPKNNN